MLSVFPLRNRLKALLSMPITPANWAWEIFLPAVAGKLDSDIIREARTTQFALCELCDVPVLLDERVVRRVDIRYNMHGTDCVVYEVENDA